ADDFIEERGPLAAEPLEHLSSVGADAFFNSVHDALVSKAQCLPGISMLAQQQGDAKARLALASRVGATESCPTGFARQAERVEPCRIVAIDASRKDRALPGRRRQFESVECCHHRAQAVNAREPMGRVHAVPREQESLEI